MSVQYFHVIYKCPYKLFYRYIFVHTIFVPDIYKYTRGNHILIKLEYFKNKGLYIAKRALQSHC